MNSTSSDLCDPSPGLYQQIVGTGLFLVAWPLVVIDSRFLPLGRPAAALLGAAMMVFFSVISQDEVYEVEGRQGNLQTLFLLVGMMLLAYYFDREGLLRLLALSIFGSTSTPMRSVLWRVCLLAGVLAAFITNDATALVLSPLLLIEFKRQGRPHKEILPLALGITTSANIGSAATVFGNRQNAVISSAADIPLIEFLKTELPAAMLGLAISVGLLYILFYRVLFGQRSEKEDEEERKERKRAYAEGVELQPCAGTIAEERHATFLDLDHTSDPLLTSQIAQEREAMFVGDQLIPSRSQHSIGHGRARLSTSCSLHSLSRGRSCHSISSHHHHVGHSPGPVLVEVTLPEIRVTHSQPRVEGEEEEVVEVLRERDVVVVESYPDPVPLTTPLRERGRRDLLFIAWLAFISVLTVVLLALPPPPVVAAEFNLGVVPLGAAILTMFVDSILNRRTSFEAIASIDWTVVLMLMGLFAWLRGFQNTCVPHLVFESLSPYMDLHTFSGAILFTVFVVVGSNIFSNVSLTILMVDKLPLLFCGGVACRGPLGGLLLSWVVTVSGNMTLIGAITNLIVAEKTRSIAGYRLTFLRYARFGLISSLIVIFTGLPVVYTLARYTTES